MEPKDIKPGMQFFMLCTHEATISEVVVVGASGREPRKFIVRNVGDDALYEAWAFQLHSCRETAASAIDDSIGTHLRTISKLEGLRNSITHPPTGDEDDTEELPTHDIGEPIGASK